VARQNDTLANFGATTNAEQAVTTSSNGPITLATKTSPAFLQLQNVGTTPVFYRLTKDSLLDIASTASGKYTGILAAGGADDDGTGGVMTFAGYTGGLAFCTVSGTSTVNITYSGRLGN
jgi:hypothetical protein